MPQISPPPGQGWPTFHGGPAQMPFGPRTSRRYVFYDREEVWGPNRQTRFFHDNIRTADGRYKDHSFTNLYHAGILGSPLSMQVMYLSIYPVSGDDAYLAEYDRFAKSQSVFEWFVGQNIRFTERPLALMSVRSAADRLYRDRITNEMCYVQVEDGKLAVIPFKPVGEAPLEAVFADKGSPRFLDVTTPDGKGRYIDSTESFMAVIKNQNPDPSAKGIDVYVCMEGIIYLPT